MTTRVHSTQFKQSPRTSMSEGWDKLTDMKIIIVPAVLVAALVLTGCSGAGNTNPTANESAKSGSATEAPQAPDLTGTWKQTNSNSEDSYQQATVTEDTIAVDWVSDGGDTTSIYWVGTLEAPSDADEPYTWASQRDVAATESAIMASGDDTKDFTYEDGVISYKLTALGTTMTVKLEKQ